MFRISTFACFEAVKYVITFYQMVYSICHFIIDILVCHWLNLHFILANTHTSYTASPIELNCTKPAGVHFPCTNVTQCLTTIERCIVNQLCLFPKTIVTRLDHTGSTILLMLFMTSHKLIDSRLQLFFIIIVHKSHSFFFFFITFTCRT